MTSPENIIKLRKERAWLGKWGESVHSVIADKQNELKVVDKLMAGNDEAMEDLKAAAKAAGRYRVTLDDIKHCGTQREALRFVTEVTFGLAHLGEVAELVVDARMSKADKDSVRSTLYHYVSDAEDLVHIGKSWVWNLDFGPAPTLEEVEADEAPADQEDAADGGGATADSEDQADSESDGGPAPEPVAGGEKAA